MIKKIDYKKDYKELYSFKEVPQIINIPKMKFVIIEGEGDPNGEAFGEVMQALYSFSYTVKMSYKSNDIPKDYYEYKVFPLEGVWDLIDKSKPSTDKSNFKYQVMIRQPEFLTKELFDKFLDKVKSKKPNKFLDKILFKEIEEGLCCQMLHVGSYDDEPKSFKIMEDYCKENSYTRITKVHREIYMSDPRKTKISKLKTILRFQIK